MKKYYLLILGSIMLLVFACDTEDKSNQNSGSDFGFVMHGYLNIKKNEEY